MRNVHLISYVESIEKKHVGIIISDLESRSAYWVLLIAKHDKLLPAVELLRSVFCYDTCKFCSASHCLLVSNSSVARDLLHSLQKNSLVAMA